MNLMKQSPLQKQLRDLSKMETERDLLIESPYAEPLYENIQSPEKIVSNSTRWPKLGKQIIGLHIEQGRKGEIYAALLSTGRVILEEDLPDGLIRDEDDNGLVYLCL